MLTEQRMSRTLKCSRSCQPGLSVLRKQMLRQPRRAAHRLVAHEAASARRALSGRLHESVASPRTQPQRQPLRRTHI